MGLGSIARAVWPNYYTRLSYISFSSHILSSAQVINHSTAYIMRVWHDFKYSAACCLLGVTNWPIPATWSFIFCLPVCIASRTKALICCCHVCWIWFVFNLVTCSAHMGFLYFLRVYLCFHHYWRLFAHYRHNLSSRKTEIRSLPEETECENCGFFSGYSKNTFFSLLRRLKTSLHKRKTSFYCS